MGFTITSTRVALGMVSGFLWVSCLMNDKNPTHDIWPLAVGREWRYVDSTIYRSASGAVDSVHLDSSRFTLTAKKTIVVNGKNEEVYLGFWQSGDVSIQSLPVALQVYYQIEGHSLYNCGAERDTAKIFDKVLHVQYPAQKGASYSTHFYSYTVENGREFFRVDTVRVDVLNTDTLWIGPAGKFSAIKFRGTNKDQTFAEAWYAPDVGYLGSQSVSLQVIAGVSKTVVSKKVLKSYPVRID